ncbi:MAG TPA: hypothetical protein VJ553_03925, partial [Candidatus Paceibacterota bacterium]|nr:hypothetical protein [Candidatus Paceibacterota bacterium]
KDEPPEPQPAGECIVCRGQLVPDMRTPLYNRAMLFGSSMPGQHDGWYCERCGIRYHHLPSHPPLRDEGGIRH